MARIVVKDLLENAELDREAMRAIVGGNAGLRTAIPALQPPHFQNPLSFSTVRLLPAGMEPRFGR